ncbi:MAG: DUF4838 domain-containing protein, partial [Armatimonadetes bacterium]|nr:DUF4838 domain-containing protein [Candidatus Hippobium faecium]
YEFFERYCGVKFYTNDVELVPKKDILETPKTLNYSYVPPFFFRDCDFANLFCELPFYVKARLNGNYRIKSDLGGRINLIGFVHTFVNLMPKKDYFTEHPEYFSLVNGERKAGAEGQLCLSNPQMRAELAKNVIKTLDETKNPKMISVSQNDNAAFCQCENCQKLYEKYGARSGALLECVNYVAKEVKKKYPNVLVETLAYGPSLYPPKKIKAEKNVIIRVCDIECNFSDPIENKGNKAPYKKISGRLLTGLNKDTINREFAEYLEKWGKIAKYIYVWDYDANFSNYHIVHPNFHVLKPNIEFFLKNGAISVFEEGDRSNNRASFNEIKSYMIYKLLWDPSLDDRELMEDFCRFVYKDGGDDIIKIIDILTDDVIKANIYLPTYVYNNEWISNSVMIDVIKLFQDALAKTESEAIANDKIYNMYIDFIYGAYLKENKDWEEISTACSLPWADKYEYEKEFTEYNESHGNLYMNEGHLITPKEKPFETRISGMVPEVCQGVNAEDWFEIDDRDFKITDKLPKLYEDKDAAFGTVTYLVPDNQEWSLMRDFGGNILEYKSRGKKYIDLYVVCKTAGKKTEEGPVLYLGVYDMNVMTGRFHKSVPISKVNDDEFSVVFVGTFDIRPAKSGTFYLTPAKNPGSADNIIVDRIIGIARE